MHARPGDADESIDAALLLLQLGREEDASELLGAASERWPRDPELAWLAWSLCSPDACDRASLLRRMVELDPDNAVSWMYAVEDASRRRDEAAIDAALGRAAHAKAYATHEGVLFLHGMGFAREISLPDACIAVMQRIMDGNSNTPATAADIALMEAEAMEFRASPPTYSVAAACRPPKAPPGSSRRAACLGLLSRLAGADSLLDRVVGAGGFLDLRPDLPRTDPRRETYRQLRWLTEYAPRLSISPRSLPRMHAEGGWKTLVAIAEEQGFWPPPKDWLPERPEARSRVLGPSSPSPDPGGAAPR